MIWSSENISRGLWNIWKCLSRSLTKWWNPDRWHGAKHSPAFLTCGRPFGWNFEFEDFQWHFTRFESPDIWIDIRSEKCWKTSLELTFEVSFGDLVLWKLYQEASGKCENVWAEVWLNGEIQPDDTCSSLVGPLASRRMRFCCHFVDLQMATDAAGECFAPHLPFLFLEGECHKLCARTR